MPRRDQRASALKRDPLINRPVIMSSSAAHVDKKQRLQQEIDNKNDKMQFPNLPSFPEGNVNTHALSFQFAGFGPNSGMIDGVDSIPGFPSRILQQHRLLMHNFPYSI